VGACRAWGGPTRTSASCLLFVGGRCVLRDQQGRVLLIRRADNGHWALPGGAMEVGESIGDCARREVYEETGLTVHELTMAAMYTGARYIHTNMYGHPYQLHVTAFRADSWSGVLLRQTDETTDARFFPLDALPEPLTGTVPETLFDLDVFERTGRVVLH
jgi:8-oxo-dGTP pyrophosphatase MutT (NUDIX family)